MLSGFRTQNTIAAVTRREAPCFLTAVLTAPFPGDRAQNTLQEQQGTGRGWRVMGGTGWEWGAREVPVARVRGACAPAE